MVPYYIRVSQEAEISLTNYRTPAASTFIHYNNTTTHDFLIGRPFVKGREVNDAFS